MDDSVVSPRNSRTTRPFPAAVLAVSVGLMLLQLVPGMTPVTVQARRPQPPPRVSAASAAIKAVGFDETYRTDDGIVMQITEIDERKLGPFPQTDDPDAKEGDPFVLFATKTTNRTEATLELVPGAVVKYGPEKAAAAQVLVDEIDGAVDVGPKEAYDYAVGFIIPRESYDQVVMELTVTIDPLRTAVFSGSITPK